MERGEEWGGCEASKNFTFDENKVEKKGADNSSMDLKLDFQEIDQETEFNVEITGEDIETMRDQADTFHKYEESGEMDGSYSFEIEDAIGKLKEAPELNINEKELTDVEVKKYDKTKDSYIKKAVKEKTEEAEEKKWDKEKLQEEIESAEAGVEAKMASYLKDIYGDERLKEKGLEVSDARWDRMAKGLKYSIANKNWDEVITRAGHMNNIDPVKFKEYQKSDKMPFHADVKQKLLEEIDDVRKAKVFDIGKFIKDIELVAKCFSKDEDIGKKISITVSEKEMMLGHLDRV